MTCCLPHFLVPKALLSLLPCVVLSLSKWCSYYRWVVVLMVRLPWTMLSPEAPPLLSLRIPMTFFILLLPACRQSVWCDCLKCPWAQWFQKAFVLIYQIWQDPWVRASSASTCCTKNMFGNWKCTIFPSPKNVESVAPQRGCCVCVGLTVLLLNVFSLSTWSLRTYMFMAFYLICNT